MKKRRFAFMILFSVGLLSISLSITLQVGAKERKLMASDPSKNATFGYSVAVSGNTAVVGAWQDTIGSKAAQGSVYVYIRKENVWIEQAKLIAADGMRKDYFGQSLAIDGDTLVVGVPQADIGKDKDQGAVYVFTRKGDHWAEQVKLKATGGASANLFGQSVGISGDTIIVGAPGNDNYPNDKVTQAHGAAYIFTRNNNIWTEQQKLISGNKSTGAFGSIVAISNKTAVIGAVTDDNAKGAVYVFSNAGVKWEQEAKLVSDSKETNDQFGNSGIAIDGSTVVVGAARADKTGKGAVYIFTRNNMKWMQEAKLTAKDGSSQDLFGQSVSISNDNIVVGAWFMSNQTRGSAYIFTRKRSPNEIVWVEQQKLTAIDGNPFDRFGFSVGISGDTVIVGADNQDIKTPNSNFGAAYVFDVVQ